MSFAAITQYAPPPPVYGPQSELMSVSIVTPLKVSESVGSDGRQMPPPARPAAPQPHSAISASTVASPLPLASVPLSEPRKNRHPGSAASVIAIASRFMSIVIKRRARLDRWSTSIVWQHETRDDRDVP
jgi:hypothetical protein